MGLAPPQYNWWAKAHPTYSGLLTLAEATPNGYIQLAQAKVLEGPESWGPMAIVSGRLILRDMNRMICIDVTDR